MTNSKSTPGSTPRSAPRSPRRLQRGVRARAAVTLTRRGRLLRTAVVLSLLAAAVLQLGTAGAEAVGTAPGTATVVVRPGDTLLELAASHGPDGVGGQLQAQRIANHNGVDPLSLRPGQVLHLPSP